jgi:hypothetical protein
VTGSRRRPGDPLRAGPPADARPVLLGHGRLGFRERGPRRRHGFPCVDGADMPGGDRKGGEEVLQHADAVLVQPGLGARVRPGPGGRVVPTAGCVYGVWRWCSWVGLSTAVALIPGPPVRPRTAATGRRRRRGRPLLAIRARDHIERSPGHPGSVKPAWEEHDQPRAGDLPRPACRSTGADATDRESAPKWTDSGGVVSVVPRGSTGTADAVSLVVSPGDLPRTVTVFEPPRFAGVRH